MFSIFKKKSRDHFLGAVPKDVCNGYVRAEHITLVIVEENKVIIYLINGRTWILELDDPETAINVSEWLRNHSNKILNRK
jgi:hypothetical protein